MKAKTIIKLATLSANIYAISKEPHIMNKLKSLSAQGLNKINEVISEKSEEEDGNEIPFTDRLLIKAKEVREEIEERIGEIVAAFYEKVNIAHTDQLKELEDKLEEMSKTLAQAEARIKKLEKKSTTG